MNKKQYISVTELAKKFNISKSLLFYYLKMELIRVDMSFGSMYLFNRKKIIHALKMIFKLRDKGFSLQEIKNKIQCK